MRRNRRAIRRARPARPRPRSRACTALAPTASFSRSRTPDAIDAGVFHNDVIAVGNGGVLFAHEKAFLDQGAVFNALRAAFAPGRR